MSAKSDLYKAAGVDIDLAQNLLSKVKSKIGSTRRPEMLAPIGGFGGMFQVDIKKYQEPVMVTSIDGVGTKLMIASMMNKWDTVGKDIVNHCIDDIIVQGAEPTCFMDYIGVGKLKSPLYENILEGMADACLAQDVSIVGGETAEMPGMYGDDLDIVGCITGMVEKSKIIDGRDMKPGLVAVGIASNGLHTNGYSLARKVLFDMAKFDVNDTPSELNGTSVGLALLEPHTCYWQAIKQVLVEEITVGGIAHITGGGLYDNVPRILSDDVDFEYNQEILPILPIFSLIQKKGEIGLQEMYRVFNMGVGMIVFVEASDAPRVREICIEKGFSSEFIGKTIPGSKKVVINGIDK
jgi:phosphoribosylformylglycinamidine cyclo-ligase